MVTAGMSRGSANLRCRRLLVATLASVSYTECISIRVAGRMQAFNRVFTTERLLQIIFVLGATVIMKLLS